MPKPLPDQIQGAAGTSPDLDRGTRIRLTTEGRYNLFPVWSPDARWIALGSDRTGPMSAFRMRSDGSGEAEPILEEGTNAVAESWSSDGRYLAFDTIAGLNIIVLPLLEDGPPFSFLQTRFFNPVAEVLSRHPVPCLCVR